MKDKCNCPCHQGAGIMHMVPNPNPPKQPKSGPTSNGTGYYQANYQMVLGPCPCDLNIKIQKLTREYYEREN